jgi:hypothetical protein
MPTKRYINGDLTVSDNSFTNSIVFARGGQIRVTLGDANDVGVSDPTVFVNCNTDAAVMLYGFPDNVRRRLYPGQSIEVVARSVDGTEDPGSFAWSCIRQPGRFPIDANVSTLYLADALHGGNDDNDGLSPLRPIRTNSLATAIIYRELDCFFMTPVRSLAAGSVFSNDHVIASSQPLGSNLVQLSVHGTGDALVSSLDLPAVSVGDGAELDIRIAAGSRLVLQGNMNCHPGVPCGILQHNDGLFDQEGTVLIIGSGVRNRTDGIENPSAYFYDGPTPGASIANGFQVAGCFGDIFRMDEGGGRFTLSGPIDPIMLNGQYCFADRVFAIYGTNQLISNAVVGWSWASLGPSRVGGQAILLHSGPTIPGGGGPVATQHGLITSSKW